MPSIQEIWSKHKGKIITTVVAGGAGLVYAAFGGFSGAPVEQEKAKSIEPPGETPIGLVTPVPTLTESTPSEPSPTGQPTESGPGSGTVIFRGVEFSKEPSKEKFPPGCATVSISYAVPLEQLKEAGIKPGDTLYMKRDTGDSSFLWTCDKNGKRHFNQQLPSKGYLPQPGKWH